jgi:FtsP/CotA-like multicopper oxidase with cupredoxin domain
LARPASRRDFLKQSAAAAALAALTGACNRPDAGPAGTGEGTGTRIAPAADASPHDTAAHGAGAAASDSTADPRAAADAMDRLHEEGIRKYPAKTEGLGNQPLAPRLEEGVKVFELTSEEIQWEVSPGQRVKAWAYNRQVPGPQIRVREGERVRVVLTNRLAESTSIHFHGLEVPESQDGVPFVTQPPIKPGDTYTYEFTVPNAGSHMYHSHHNSAKQVGMGLLGAFVVEPRRPNPRHRADVDYVMVINDTYHGYTLNGKGFPATEPIVCKRGQVVRIRFMNEGQMIHPMHLHGMHMTVIARDGWDLPQPWKADTVNVAPGERWDVLVRAHNPGKWAFHCHILPHAELEHGMFGMVTLMIVEA